MLYDSDPCGISLKAVKYYNEHYSFYRMKEHSHDAFELMYIRGGKCRVTCTDPKSGRVSEYTLCGGSYIYIYSGIRHNLFVDREYPCRILNIEIETVPKINDVSLTPALDSQSFRSFISAATPWAVVRDDGSMYTYISELHEKLYESGCYDDRVIISELTGDDRLDIFLSMFQIVLKLAVQTQSAAGASSQTYIRRALRFIREHYDGTENLTVSNIASYAHVSDAYLQRLFRESTDMTLSEYITSLRLKKATHLIEKTDLSMVDVAINSGFGSRQRLYQVFMSKFGVSPGKYRAMHRNVELDFS